ncbi:Ovate protein family [Macleaya cordata]|uniref:Transcription repressor n=1 Tax=Macleaya cordata TaxID=56857 RepID=A0A200Q9E5_MACCD|nr:Ovate protein family [Macleaya cordata]
MSSNNRRKLLQNSIAVSVGCSCRRLKLTDIFRPKTRRPKTGLNRIKTSSNFTKPDLLCNSSSSSWDKGTGLSLDEEEEEDESNTTFGTTPHYYSEPEPEDSDPNSSKKVKGFGRIGESLAVEKDSDDPYLDFRHSMLQMILEKEIYSRDDLRELLQCFLSLNSPYHHDIIVRAFTEIWNGVFSVKPYDLKSKSREF